MATIYNNGFRNKRMMKERNYKNTSLGCCGLEERQQPWWLHRQAEGAAGRAEETKLRQALEQGKHNCTRKCLVYRRIWDKLKHPFNSGLQPGHEPGYPGYFCCRLKWFWSSLMRTLNQTLSNNLKINATSVPRVVAVLTGLPEFAIQSKKAIVWFWYLAVTTKSYTILQSNLKERNFNRIKLLKRSNQSWTISMAKSTMTPFIRCHTWKQPLKKTWGCFRQLSGILIKFCQLTLTNYLNLCFRVYIIDEI